MIEEVFRGLKAFQLQEAGGREGTEEGRSGGVGWGGGGEERETLPSQPSPLPMGMLENRKDKGNGSKCAGKCPSFSLNDAVYMFLQERLLWASC